MALAIAKSKPKDIVYQDDLTIEWRDGLVAHYPFFFLRDSCPCASCIDEISGEKILDPSTIPSDIHIRKAEYVGNYALRITWSDGHDTGLFAFRNLREIFDEAMDKGGDDSGPHPHKV